jgi:hypothetical protein
VHSSRRTTGGGPRLFIEVALAREAIDVWRQWRPGRSPTLADEVAAVIHYALYDAWLPME